MASDETLSGSDGQMVVSYAVAVIGIQRSKREIAAVTDAINSVRQAVYSPGKDGQPGITMTQARFGSKSERFAGNSRTTTGRDIFSEKMVLLEGNIQSGVSKALAKNMAFGKKVQAATLRAAKTRTGSAGGTHTKGARAGGSGRDDTGKLINALKTNVEDQRTAAVTKYVAWHGWDKDREDYFKYQEQGSKGRPSAQPKKTKNQLGSVKRRVRGLDPKNTSGVPAANSLGAAIINVRESLKADLAKYVRVES